MTDDELGPLTDDELERMETQARHDVHAFTKEYLTDPLDVLALVAEVRRLRAILSPPVAPEPTIPCCEHRGWASHFTDDGAAVPGAKCNTKGCPCEGWDGNEP